MSLTSRQARFLLSLIHSKEKNRFIENLLSKKV